MNVKRFIFTGTPGSGKTSVITALELGGKAVIHEAATDVIAMEQEKGINHPWKKPDFLDKIVNLQKKRQKKAIGNVQFYDRSPFCTYALAQYLNYAYPSMLLEEIDRCIKNSIYQNNVFFFENLGFIDHTDARTISYEDALVFEKIHLDVYKKFGFDLIVVPKELSIEDRYQFILRAIV